MAKKPLPTPEELRQLLDYNPETGELIWRTRDSRWFEDGFRTAEGEANNWNSRYSGKVAGSICQNGYRYITAPGGRRMLAHRAAFAIAHGHWPDICDHINGDPLDNRISNLRSVDQSENLRNARKWSHNTSGKTGVCFDKRSEKWMAYIKVNRKMKFLGYRKDFAEAAELRAAAEIEYGFTDRHGR